jgi:hypothetical protein
VKKRVILKFGRKAVVRNWKFVGMGQIEDIDEFIKTIK